MIETFKTPENDWSKILETVSRQGFLINTSTPRDISDGGGVRSAQYEKNTSERKFDDSVSKRIQEEALGYTIENKDIFKRTPEAVVFTPDNKLLYIISPGKVLNEAHKKLVGSTPVYELSEKDQVLWHMANWRDIHSFPPRAGNEINLIIDLEKDILDQLEKNVADDPAKIREVLQKIVKERMQLENYWRTWDPDTLTLQDIPTQSCSSEEMPGSAIRPPWEFWDKLGLNEIFVQYSDSTKGKPHTEYRKIESKKE